jgi:hypothetical protein
MSPSELAVLFDQFPHDKFRLTLASGDQVIVHYPQKVIFDTLSMIMGRYEGEDPRIASRLEYISVPNVVRCEKLSANDIPPPRGRRRR